MLFTKEALNEWEIEYPGKKILNQEEESLGICVRIFLREKFTQDQGTQTQVE